MTHPIGSITTIIVFVSLAAALLIGAAVSTHRETIRRKHDHNRAKAYHQKG